MSKFKAGDKVKVVASTFSESAEEKNLIGKVCTVYRAWSPRLDKYYIYHKDKHKLSNFNESDLEPVEKTWDTLEVGDVIEDLNGSASRVLAVCGEAFLRSYRSDHDSAGGWYTIAEAKKDGWKIQQPTPSEPETIEILGKTYHKADVEERLSGLEEV